MCVLEPTNVFAAQINATARILCQTKCRSHNGKTHVFDDTNIKFFCMEKDAITKVKSLLALICDELL